MMWPAFFGRITLRASRVQRNTPFTFVSNICSNFSNVVSERSGVGTPRPALFTRMSTVPNCSRHAAKAACTLASTRTSPQNVLSESDAASCWRLSNRSAVRVMANTFAPAATSFKAAARPIPLPAPVMKQTFP